MIVALLIGALVGFIIAMPPGPVGVTSMKLGLNKGLKSAALFSLGSGFLDVFFCILAVFAASAAVAVLSDFMESHPFITIILQVLVVVGFIIFGIYSLKRAKLCAEQNELNARLPKSEYIEYLKEKGPFFLGIAIAMTNIANPTFLPSLTYISMQIHQLSIYEIGGWNNLMYSIGFGFGNFLWLYLLASMVIKLKNIFSDIFIIRVRQFAGYTYICFGSLLGWRLIAFTNWSEIFKLTMVL